jgi:hypothetical protein
LVQAAKMLVENSAFQRAKQLEEEMRKNSLVHMAISTAKTILYYTPVIFVTRFEFLYAYRLSILNKKSQTPTNIRMRLK